MILLGTLTVGPTVTVLIDKSRVKFLFGVDVCSCTCHKTVVVILSSTPPRQSRVKVIKAPIEQSCGLQPTAVAMWERPQGTPPEAWHSTPTRLAVSWWSERPEPSRICMYVCIYIYYIHTLHTCVYIYICVYVYTYTCIYK